jgi:hypothetical protein
VGLGQDQILTYGGPNGYYTNEYVEGGGLMTRRCQGSENPPINWCGAGSVTYSSVMFIQLVLLLTCQPVLKLS